MPPISELTDASKIQTKSPSELYSLSKMAICLHTVELSRRLKGSKETENIKVFAIRPGFIKGKRSEHIIQHRILYLFMQAQNWADIRTFYSAFLRSL